MEKKVRKTNFFFLNTGELTLIFDITGIIIIMR